MTAYWIAHVTITDADAYARYQALAPEAFARHGAVFLARGSGDAAQVLEGPALDRHVVIAFPSLEAARACYDSPEYRKAREARQGAAVAHVVLVEGRAGPDAGRPLTGPEQA